MRQRVPTQPDRHTSKTGAHASLAIGDRALGLAPSAYLQLDDNSPPQQAHRRAAHALPRYTPGAGALRGLLPASHGRAEGHPGLVNREGASQPSRCKP